MLSVSDIDALAARAHAGQYDKIGVPYIEHVRAVAAGLAPLGQHLVQAGLLHDILEDTPWTAAQLRKAGVPGTPYEDKIARITADPDATLVKISDNAHNSRPDRAGQLKATQRARLSRKYQAARDQLWPAARREDISAIIRIVNPALLQALDGTPAQRPRP
ncbi:HD domain-containing protein [Streptomyces venezuelae]|uniref:HD domain-containing protein n=1 Tax=Streptomyces venezuelae TaxID=54571 RepID=UPI003443AC68